MNTFDWKRFGMAMGLQGLLIAPVLWIVGDLRGVRLVATAGAAGAVLTGAQVVQSHMPYSMVGGASTNVIPAAGGPEGTRANVIDVEGREIPAGQQEVMA